MDVRGKFSRNVFCRGKLRLNHLKSICCVDCGGISNPNEFLCCFLDFCELFENRKFLSCKFRVFLLIIWSGY